MLIALQNYGRVLGTMICTFCRATSIYLSDNRLVCPLVMSAINHYITGCEYGVLLIQSFVVALTYKYHKYY